MRTRIGSVFGGRDQEKQREIFTDGQRRIVCTLTGHGLKDPDTAVKRSAKHHIVKPDMGEILNILKL